MSAAVGASEGAGIVQPLVAGKPGRWPVWVFAGAMVVLAIGLFAGLEARRTSISSPSTSPGVDPATGMIASPPELAIPGAPASVGEVPFAALAPSPQQAILPVGPVAPMPRIQIPRIPRSSTYDPEGPINPALRSPQQSTTGYQPPAVIYQAPTAAAAPAPPATASDGSIIPTLKTARAEAGRLVNPATTVPQGAVIQAVLETALASDRPGFVRAIVSQDVRGFDGSRILIPRGSRLYGEYRADLVPGQKRAFILWQRLMRPDGVIIAIDSPAADPLGRAGVGGKVNSHFFERFGGAILQSALDIGVNLATRSITDGTIILGMPGSTTQINATSPQSIKPTLSVRHGTSVSVFVARDLDFVTVEQ